MNQQPGHDHHDHHGHHPSNGHNHGRPDTPIEHAAHDDHAVQHSSEHAHHGMHTETVTAGSPDPQVGHDAHAGHGSGSQGHDSHADHDPGAHAGHSVAMFRNRFWVTLVLSIPVVAFSPMIAMIFGYHLPETGWTTWIAPVLGTVIFFYGGMPFLKGAWREISFGSPG